MSLAWKPSIGSVGTVAAENSSVGSPVSANLIAPHRRRRCARGRACRLDGDAANEGVVGIQFHRAGAGNREGAGARTGAPRARLVCDDTGSCFPSAGVRPRLVISSRQSGRSNSMKLTLIDGPPIPVPTSRKTHRIRIPPPGTCRQSYRPRRHPPISGPPRSDPDDFKAQRANQFVYDMSKRLKMLIFISRQATIDRRLPTLLFIHLLLDPG